MYVYHQQSSGPVIIMPIKHTTTQKSEVLIHSRLPPYCRTLHNRAESKDVAGQHTMLHILLLNSCNTIMVIC